MSLDTSKISKSQSVVSMIRILLSCASPLTDYHAVKR